MNDIFTGLWSLINEAYLVLSFFFYAIALYNVVVIIREEVNPSSAITWIFVNLSFPFIGVPLYFFLGQTKVKSYRKRRQKVERFFRPHLTPSKNQRPVQTINKLTMLNTGDLAFDTMFGAMEAAQDFILIQYYIFRPDKLGERFKKILMDKAEAGVAVYFIYDNLGSIGLTGQYTRQLKKSGVHVARFLPMQLRFNLQINFRNHRKLVLVDNQKAFIGGMNVGVEYLGHKSFWRDTQVMIEGPAILELAATFNEDWNFAASKSRRYQLKKTLAKNLPRAVETGSPTQVFSFGPGDRLNIGLYVFMEFLQSAKESITIATPYFIPDLTLERCLELALLKGIEVRLIVPMRADHWYVGLVNQYYIRRLARFGAKVYLYQKGFMHQKVILVDDKKTLIGTANFDNRSIYLNFETSILVSCSIFSEETKNMLAQDRQDSLLFDPRKDPFWYRYSSKVFRLLSPLF